MLSRISRTVVFFAIVECLVSGLVGCGKSGINISSSPGGAGGTNTLSPAGGGGAISTRLDGVGGTGLGGAGGSSDGGIKDALGSGGTSQGDASGSGDLEDSSQREVAEEMSMRSAVERLI